MNTPEPCCKCKHLYYNCLLVDDPNDHSECWIIAFPDDKNKPLWGDDKCPRFKDYEEKE